MAVGLSRRICQRWIARYNKQGLAGLDDLRGRKSELPLTEEQLAAVCGAVRHDILEFSARVLATFPCEILRFSEIPVEFSL